jgi:uncharacterized protein (TIGR02646 family)
VRHIRKGSEPHALTEHRLAPHATYDNLEAATLAEMRGALAQEQGALCAYCMSRIEANSVRIEHYVPRSDAEEGVQRQLEWRNLLGVCDGGEGKRPADQHCDVRRGNAALRVDPRHERITRSISYAKANGRIASDDSVMDDDLNDRLNLNVERLCSNRRAAVSGFVAALEKLQPNSWSRTFVERHLGQLSSEPTRVLEPYCGILEYYLRKKLATF